MLPHALPALAIGLAAGVLSGMFGIGGGIITTPALRLLLDAPALVAVGTPLPVILPTAVTGAWSYARRGIADIRLGLALGAVGAPASVLAALATRRVGGGVVLVGTALLIAYASVDMLVGALQSIPPIAEPGGPVSRHPRSGRVTALRVVLVGGIAGVYSGFFGLGGGFVLVPGINRLLGLELKPAIATSLVAVALLAVPGSVTHYLLGNVDPAYAIALSLGVVPGAWIGAHITMGARERTIRLAFAGVLAVTGILLGLSEGGVL